MKTSNLSCLALAGGVAAQGLASNPGGAMPAGVQAPTIAGFGNSTIQPSRGGFSVCVSGTVNVTASTSKNLKLNYTIPANQTQVTETFLGDMTAGSTAAQQLVAGTQAVNGTFTIGATLCTPANDTKPSKVQLLTHGVGFDRYYWDFAPGYSYVDVASQYNYATFFYDRLGVGVSDKPDAIQVVQTPLEVEIAQALAEMLRSGQFSNTTFDSVVGVGHSLGSAITQAITFEHPTSLDAAILTGFSVNSTAIPTFTTGLNLAIASQNQPYRFSGLSNGYLVSSSAISSQIGFYRSPGFDPLVFAAADAAKGTVTIAELLTLSAIGGPATNFTGPVAVINGAEDLPFCSGNCSYPVNLAQEVFKPLYPNTPTTKLGAYLAPVTGHAANLHYSATGSYLFVQEFLQKQGL